jgi:hypothetical protein
MGKVHESVSTKAPRPSDGRGMCENINKRHVRLCERPMARYMREIPDVSPDILCRRVLAFVMGLAEFSFAYTFQPQGHQVI